MGQELGPIAAAAVAGILRTFALQSRANVVWISEAAVAAAADSAGLANGGCSATSNSIFWPVAPAMRVAAAGPKLRDVESSLREADVVVAAAARPR